jgi:hypothetical protein
MRKPGCIEPVIFFRYPNGHLTLAPYSEFPTPDGAIREEAHTLREVDVLERRLQQQEHENWEREAQRDESLLEQRRAKLKARLYARMTSSTTDQYEKDFIREWMKLRNDHPKKLYHADQFQCYLTARHFDIGNRPADKESFNVERHEVKS